MKENHPVSRKARDFIWRALHDGHRIGKYWTHIPGYEARATCETCGAIESLEHILCECLAPGQRAAWALARGILARKSVRLPKVSLGIALGGHTFTALDEKGDPLHGATRLARIVLTETAYLIWVLRCDRVVGGRESLPGALEEAFVEHRWMMALNKRLSNECVLVSKRVAGKWAVPAPTVLATWEKTLQDERNLPPDWTHSPGVLVGKPLQLYEPEGG